MCKVKVCLYWFSVILPVIDIVKGAINGIVSVFHDVHQERLENELKLKEEQMKRSFQNDN